MANSVGRQVVVLLTNKSGGSVVLGDVVVVDTTTDESFTTTTSAASTSAIGVAAETIANNATGRIIVGGYVSLVNVSASVTRNQFGTTHTVAKQAVASATRVAGTFCRWLKTSATPSAYIYPVDLAGAALTNPMSAVGDIIQGTTAGAPARLAAPAAGKVLTGAGVTTSVVWAYPPGYELAYAEITSAVTINVASPEASAVSIVSAGAVSFDGSTRVCIEFWTPHIETPQTDADPLSILLFDGSTSLGYVGRAYLDMSIVGAGDLVIGSYVRRFLTPSNASHTYSIRGTQASGSGTVQAGPGGAGQWNPAYIRITVA